MKKLFISQPMRGKADREILAERNKAIEKAKELVGEDIEALDTFFDFPDGAKPLEYLAKSLEFLSKADIALFIGDWKNYRGCRIEHLCATEYGINIIEE